MTNNLNDDRAPLGGVLVEPELGEILGRGEQVKDLLVIQLQKGDLQHSRVETGRIGSD